VYVDDFLALSQSEALANASQAFLISLLAFLGLRDKLSKRTPAAQSLTFVGFLFDFPSLSVSIAPVRASEILAEVTRVVTRKWVLRSALLSWLGS
jgi:hypothetical protein